MIDPLRNDLIAELDMLLTSAQLQQAWEAESSLTALPSITFTAEGYRVAMHFSSDGGSLPGIQQIKRSFTIAMRRKGAFPSCKIQWLT
jgi:hypothetical protein